MAPRKPFFTLVMANYNGAAYVEEAIASIGAQSFTDWCLIVVDDGSTDDSVARIEAALKPLMPPARLIIHETNRGQGAAFNTALQSIDSLWVAFLDSDDLWTPQKLERTAKSLAEAPGATALLQHPLRIHYNDTSTQEIFPEYAIGGDVLKWMRQHRRLPKFVPTTGLVFSTEVLRRCLPIPELFRICADGFLTRAAACFGEVRILDEALGNYRLHNGNQVGGNQSFARSDFMRRVMVPELNAFYRRNRLELELPVPEPPTEHVPAPVSKRLWTWLPKELSHRLRRGPQAHRFASSRQGKQT
ncbi:MAG: glycosyltransferase [Opitutales bacterium]